MRSRRQALNYIDANEDENADIINSKNLEKLFQHQVQRKVE
jgi:hypothetical protein